MVAFRRLLPLLASVGLVYASAFEPVAAASPTPMPGSDESSTLMPPAVINISTLSLEELDAQLQVRVYLTQDVTKPREFFRRPCVSGTNADHLTTISTLNAHLVSTAPPPSRLSSAFDLLFPSSHPGINSLLATLYISGPPNLLLALCPTNIDPSSLQIMVSFAVGGLMGDTLFHLLPEIFLGEPEGEKARLVLVEPNRNLLLGAAILVGFMTFVAMDKGVRIATVGAGHDHGRAHEHREGSGEGAGEAKTSGAELRIGNGDARKRKDPAEQRVVADRDETGMKVNPSIRTGGYLNLIADFTHNITDGLAMAASFYASPVIGATTTVAVFFHEIPHEVGDFALLVQSGFTKWQAMGAQFVTAVGAFLGTLIGVFIQEYGGAEAGEDMPMNAGLMGTSLVWGDLLLPFTAGTFLYVATVAVIPELLETDGKPGEVNRTMAQFAAVAVGAGIMLWISWH